MEYNVNSNGKPCKTSMKSGEIIPFFTDIRGRRAKNKPFNHPYDFNPHVTYLGDYHKDKSSAVYSDRLYQWDSKKYDACCKEVFGDTGQYFDNRKSEDIERFLSLYYGEDLKLTAIQKECNVSSGYPLWVFFYERKNNLEMNGSTNTLNNDLAQ